MNSKGHMIVGGLIGLGGYLAYKHVKNESASLVGALASLLGGAFAGLLPDLLEPATNPYHRSFFHSKILSLMMLFGNFKVWQNENLDERVKWALSIFLSAYSSHLIADGGTKKGLPLFT